MGGMKNWGYKYNLLCVVYGNKMQMWLTEFVGLGKVWQSKGKTMFILILVSFVIPYVPPYISRLR